MNSNDLRQKFISFFTERGHKYLPASNLISRNDLSVLFTTAGMQQFKKFYKLPEEAPAKNVVTCQPCLRTSDIKEVGDSSHLTFFEMLGNFSFDGYFKEEAIKYAWFFLTKTLGIEKSRIYATYFRGSSELDADEESLEILNSIDGLKEVRPQSFEENFWSLQTEDSPGGPTVEFYVDGFEVWNLVFNEYIYHNKRFKKSTYKGVDTGMGLERMVAVTQLKKDVFKTDLFWPMVEIIEKGSQKKYQDYKKEFRIIADHLKAVTFLINENILPANKERGYVTRRLIRRVVAQLKKLGITEDKNIISQIIEKIIKIYPQIEKKQLVAIEVSKEVAEFSKKLISGLKIIKSIKGDISGKDLFDLYQSHGIPLEISLEEIKANKLSLDEDAQSDYQKLLKKHQELSRTASTGMFKGGLAGSGEQETKYHTVTHLLHSALRKVLSEDVKQKGSNINSERLRFDFSYHNKLTKEQIKKVEDLVNEQVKKDSPVEMKEMSLDNAKESGALGFFEDKYSDKVKVYSIGDFSKEICGGPHVKSTSELGHFKITKEESSSSGIRRIKAVLE